jgi:hypothetical protein
MKIVHLLVLLGLTFGLCSCRSYTEATPRQVFADNHPLNYRRVFKEEVPKEVTIVNSVIVGYAWRLGVVTTDDFEFELIAPASSLARWKKSFYLRPGGSPDVENRKNNPIKPWYAPGNFSDYEAYCDITSVGYVHLLVRKNPESDGRLHVFLSKH